MRGFVVLAAILIGVAPSAADAQATGRADNTNIVNSERLNTPTNNNDLTSLYEQQKALNNLPEQQKALSKLGPARPAKPAELVVGADINDKTGVFIAKIQKIDPDGVVVADGVSVVKIPADAFGHNKAGLLLDTSKADFDKRVAEAH